MIVFYIAGFTGQWRPNADSALYAAIGRNLAEGQGYVYQGEPHTWVEPLVPWLVAGSFKAFGVETFWPVHVVLLLVSLASLGLVYWLFLLHTGRPTAVLITMLVGICETVYAYPFILFTDVPFFLGVMLALVAYERIYQNLPRRRWLNWVMLVAGTCIMITARPTWYVFAGAMVLAVGWHAWRGPGRLRHIVILLVILACAVSFRLTDPRRSTPGKASVPEQKVSHLVFDRPAYMLKRTLTLTLPQTLNEITTEAVIGIGLGKVVSTVSSLAILGCGVWLARRRPLWGIYVAATVAQQIIFLPRERYYLPVMPLLLFGVWDAIDTLRRRIGPVWEPRLVVAVLVLLIAPNIVLVVRFALGQHGIGSSARRDLQKVDALTTFASDLTPVVGQRDVVLVDDHGRLLHYFSRRTMLDSPWMSKLLPGPSAVEAYYQRFESADALWLVVDREEPSRWMTRMLNATGRTIASTPVVVSGRYELHRVTPTGEMTPPARWSPPEDKTGVR